MERQQLHWIANFVWGIADDVLRDVYVRGKYALSRTDLAIQDRVYRPDPPRGADGGATPP